MRKQDEKVSVELTLGQALCIGKIFGKLGGATELSRLKGFGLTKGEIKGMQTDNATTKTYLRISEVLGKNSLKTYMSYSECFPKTKDEETLEKIAELEKTIQELKQTVKTK